MAPLSSGNAADPPPSIEGVPTDVAVFVGIAEAGPFETPTSIASWDEFREIFGGWLFHRYLAAAVSAFFREGGRTCVVVRVRPTGPEGPATVVVPPLAVRASSEGSWAAALKIRIADSPAPGAATPGFAFDVLVPAAIPAGSFGASMLARYVLDNAPPLIGVDGQPHYLLEHYPGFSQADLVADAGGGGSPFERQVNGASLFVRVGVEPSDAPARPGHTVVALAGAADSGFDFAAAIGSLAGLEGASLVAVPDSVGQPVEALDGVDLDQRALIQFLLDAMAARAGRPPLAFVLADPPAGLDPAGILRFAQPADPDTALDAGPCALYYPWLRYAADLGGGTAPLLLMPPSGAVAGRIAATDLAAGVFKAAAGTLHGRIEGSSGLERALTDREQGPLNGAGINVIRWFPGYGICIWGARTRSPDWPWRYVPVRRFALFLEHSLHRGLAWAAFEPFDDPALQVRVRGAAEEFLQGLWRRGALVGVRPPDAFYVRVDGSDVEAGRLNVEIGFAPLRPAEFVVLRIGLVARTDGQPGRDRASGIPR